MVPQRSFHMDDLLSQHPEDYALPSNVAHDLVGSCCITLSTWLGVFKFSEDETVEPPLFGLTAIAHLLMHCCTLSVEARA